MGIVKKKSRPPQTGVPGRKLVCFNPEGIKRSKSSLGRPEPAGTEGRGEEEGPGVGGLFGNWVMGLPSPCWDPPSPSGLAGRGQPATATGRSRAARCSEQGTEGGSQRFALQGDDGTAPQLLGQGAAVLDFLVAVCL